LNGEKNKGICMMFLKSDFPLLTNENHRITSPADTAYNCVAWSVGDTERWWQPDVYWPTPVPPGDFSVAVLEQAFAALGFEKCDDASLEPGFEKVAPYGTSFFYTHVARQLSTGKWTSKLGRSEDIEHDHPDNLAGGVYGVVVQFMKRRHLPVSMDVS
jgi:hypothetical protein